MERTDFELESSLRSLGSTKVTERKNGASSLQNLLQSEKVIKSLNYNSENSARIGWNVVFNVVRSYMDKEIATIQTAKETLSSTTLGNRQKKKNEIMILFKLVVKSATRGKPYLKLRSVLDSIMHGLTDSFLLENFGQDFTSLLHKCVLKVRKYWLAVSPDQWNELLELHWQLYMNEAFDRTLLASTIHELMEGAIKQGKVKTDKMLTWFQAAFISACEIQPSAQVEHLVTALNILCYSVAANSRHILCLLGFDCMKLLLTIWGKMGTDKVKLKEELIKQLHLQVVLHHPKGQGSSQDGSYAYDWESWKDQLASLHDSLVSHIESVSTRQKFLPGHKSKAVILKDDLVWLARDVFKQLPYLISSSCSPPSLNGGYADEIPMAKRMRLSPSKICLIDLIKEHSNSLQAVPWLQILTSLLDTYPAIFDKICLRQMLQALVSMLTDCSQAQLFKFVFDALTALTRIFRYHGNDLLQETLKEWQTVWTASLSNINSSQAKIEGCSQGSGFLLMSSVLDLKLLHPGKEIWNLFLPDYCKPTMASTSLLIALLKSQHVPETYFPNILGLTKDTKPFPLRRLLLQWLLSQIVESENFVEITHDVSPYRMALLCLSILHKDPMDMLEKGEILKNPAGNNNPNNLFERDTTNAVDIVIHHSYNGVEEDNMLDDLGLHFLNRGFVKDDVCKERSIKRVSGGATQLEHKNPLVCDMLDSFVKLLRSCVTSACQRNSIHTDSLPFMAWLASFLTSIALRLGRHANQTQEICSLAKTCLQTCVHLFTTATATQSDSSKCKLPQLISSLLKMISVDESSSDIADVFWVAEFIRSCLPSDFVDLIVDFANGKIPSRNNNNSSNTKDKPVKRNRYGNSLDRRPSGGVSQREDDPFETSFSGQTRNTDFDSDMDFDTAEDGAKEVDTTSQAAHHDRISNFFHPSSLKESECVRFLCVKLLCQILKFDKRKAPSGVHLEADMDNDDTRSRILEMIGTDTFQANTTLDVLNLLTISHDLMSPQYFVSSSDIRQILLAFRNVAKELSKDLQVCRVLLRHLCYFVPHLGGDQNEVPPSDSILACRKVFFKFVTDFGMLCSNISKEEVKLQYVDILLGLLKYDPSGWWGVIEVDIDDNNHDDDDDGDEVQEVTVADVFVRYLQDDNVRVGMAAAHGLKWYFIKWSENGSFNCQDRVLQRQTLENITSILSQFLNDQISIMKTGEMYRMGKRDTESNRLDVCLSAAMNVICHSSVGERECLLWVCRAVATWDIPIKNIVKMLEMVSSFRHYADVNSYLSSHLPFLLHHWFDRYKTTIKEFPFQLLGYQTLQDFVSCHLTTVVSTWFVTTRQVSAIQSVLTSLGCDVTQAFVASLPQILVYLLPCLIEEPNADNAGRAAYRKAQSSYNLLKEELLSDNEINDCVSNQLSDITVLTLGCLHMELNKNSLPMPDPNPPYYNRKEVQATLDHLAKVFPLTSDNQPSSLVTVLAKIPSGIHSVLLSIATAMSTQRCGWEKLRCIQMYDLFVGMVIEELSGGLDGGWAATLREIIQRLVATLRQISQDCDTSEGDKSFDGEIALVCLRCLKTVCRVATDSCPDEFAKYLHPTMDAIASCTSSLNPTLTSTLTPPCVDLVECLVEWSKESDPDLDNAWKTVGLLPDRECFRDINEWIGSLRQLEGKPLILRFQEVMDICNGGVAGDHTTSLAQEIDRLVSAMITNPKEVADLMKNAHGQVTLRKMCSLLLQLLTSPFSALVYASVRCLGTIGPIDLRCVSYPSVCVNSPLSRAMEFYRDGPMEKYCWFFHSLNTCLTDDNLRVVKVAGDILMAAMSTPMAMKFQEDYGRQMKGVSYLFHYLQPFQAKKKEKFMTPPTARTSQESLKALGDLDLWNPCNPVKGHQDWICDLTNALLSAAGVVTDEVLSKIGPMCQIKTSMCEESLPYLVHNALEADESRLCRNVLSQGFRHFFSQHYDTSPQTTKEPLPVCLRKESIRIMLSVVLYLRKQKRKQKSSRGNPSPELTTWDNNFWLDLDYLQVAKAAQFCQANFSAFLFTEIWWDVSRNSNSSSSGSQGRSSSSPDESCIIHPLSLVTPQQEKELHIQSFLLAVSRGIGDLDLLYGCGAGRRPESNSRVLTYLQEQEQAKALTSLDIEARRSGSLDTPLVLLQAIQGCGADHLLLKCLDGLDMHTDNDVQSPNPELEEFRYQTAWRLGQWDLSSPSSKEISEGLPFHQAVYCALSSLKENHLDVAKLAIQSARKTSILNFDSHVECSQSVYPFLSQLQCLAVLEELVAQLKTDTPQIIPSFMQAALEEESDGLSLLDHMNDFSCEQNLLEVLVSSASVLNGKQLQTVQQLQGRALWRLMVCSRQAGRFQDAEKVLCQLKSGLGQLECGRSEDSLQFEEARLYWARREPNIALHLLKTLVTSLSESKKRQTSSLLPEALATYGNWLDQTRSQSPTVIMKDYLEKSVSLIDDSSQDSPTFETSVECFVSLARFADAQYQQISDYMASPVYKEKKDLLKRTQQELKECHEYKKNNKYLRLMEKNAAIDKVELESLERDHNQFLEQALINYLRCLRDGNLHDVKVFRVVALWFENAAHKDVNQLIQASSESIASHKFLPLYYQLAARMNNTQQDKGSGFQSVLIQLMERVARRHPHHTLWIVMALAHANKDDQMIQSQAGGSNRRQRGKLASDRDEVVEEGRVQAAKEMLDRLKQEKLSSSLSSMGRKSLSQVVTNMEELSLAYIQLANQNVSEHKNERKPIPLDSSLKLCKIKNLTGILIPSVDLKVEIDGDYSQAPYPIKYAPTFKLAGGVNLPKIIVCHGSDGVDRTQLVKGNDDLRQDAVMQQVFALVNQLLMADPETKKRELNIRTYKVVPLTQKCGLLEWCEGTQPIGQYLVGNIHKPLDGAHAKYRPQDWRVMDCRLHLQRAKADPKGKMKAYLEILANFKPVFRHFFMETFKDPAVWFQRRLAYTQSVATNSIVGYILGLGDRHVQNILIDMKTAELIHIDLGIAFEMGHTLPTPETVPFRLTQDIIDGMGVVGVEGVFRRCCEKTMQVMRNNGELLLTIVQVLMYDPLSNWNLTPQLLMAIQKKREQAVTENQDSIMSTGTVPSSFQQSSGTEVIPRANGDGKDKDSKMAERTLLRLKQKLSGVEDGAQLGLEGQVNCLIQQASDPKNLSCLYAGWQPYL